MADNLVDIFNLSLAPSTAQAVRVHDEADTTAACAVAAELTPVKVSTCSAEELDEDTELMYGSLVKSEDFENNDVRIAMIGNVDSGKSTLIGVLMSASLDDGRGAARGLVLKHRHEQENGRTSAVTVEIMGYDKHDQQIVATARNHAQRWQGRPFRHYYYSNLVSNTLTSNVRILQKL
jgi:GTPase